MVTIFSDGLQAGHIIVKLKFASAMLENVNYVLRTS